MTILASHRILIGASGWQHRDWSEQFYPEDLPQDWQLAYYGNEFPVVLIREQEWQQGEVESWLDETDELPLFICQLPLRDSKNILLAADVYLQKIALLGERCIGIVCQLTNSISAETLSSLLNKCNKLAPVCIDMDAGGYSDIPQPLQKVLHAEAANIVYKEGAEISHVSGALILVNIYSDQLDLKILRQLMDNMLGYENKRENNGEEKEHRLVLLINGDPPNLQMIKQAKVLLELL